MEGHKVHLVAHFQGQSAPSTKCTMQDGWCGWTENTFSLYSSPIANHGGSIANHGGSITNHGG